LEKNISFIQWTRQHELQELVDEVFKDIKMPSCYLTVGDKALIAHARSIKDNRKDVIAVALALHDVTEIQRLARARRDFITNISHELRTPMASISLLTETLLNGALDEPEMAHNLVMKISSQTDTLCQLAQEVLDLSLIESGRAPLRLANYPLKPIVQSQIEQLLPQITRKNLQVQVDISDNQTVLVDKSMVERVIINLLHNAIKFTDEQGKITILARPLDDKTATKIDEEDVDTWVLVSVNDTGVGISPENIDRLFERFYIADQSRSQSGTGLGLAIVKHIVEGHKGKIWAESDGKTGSTFYFILPAEA
jgi:two-component system phosphate regulon sensor histidine kinase PhoR